MNQFAGMNEQYNQQMAAQEMQRDPYRNTLAPSPKSRIWEAMDGLEKDANHLCALVETLEQKLSSICTPSPATRSPDQAHPDGNSALANSLQRSRIQLRMLAARLINLLDTLEV